MDYAAATPLDLGVLKKMTPFLGLQFGNPSSLHREGREAKKAVDLARRDIANTLSVLPDEIIFTASGTESVALAIHGIANSFPKGHIVTTSVEHAAVLENVHVLQKGKHPVTIVDAHADGIVEPKDIDSAIRKDTILVSTIYVQNEIGAVHPLANIARVIRRERNRRRAGGEKTPLYFHTDACQAPEYMPMIIPRLGVDLLTLNGSKVYGPKGVGLLYKRRGVELVSLWQGGGQEQNLRSGTENVAGIIGFAEALHIAEQQKKKEHARMTGLQEYFLKKITQLVPQAKLQGPPAGPLRVLNNVNISLPGMSAQTLVLYLDERGVAASSGSACASNKKTDRSEGVRFTMGRHITRADIDYTIQALCDSIKVLRT